MAVDTSVIGKPTSAAKVVVERGPVSYFASALKDENPIYHDAGGHASALAWSGDWLFVTLDDGRLVAIGPAGGAETVDISPMPQGALVGS